MKKTKKDVPATPMPRSERYLSQRAVKAADDAFGPVKFKKRDAA